MERILKVVKQTEGTIIPKKDGGTQNKCMITLQELGGKYENCYLCSMFGNAAACKFYPGDLVLVSLKFNVHEHNGISYQDVLVQDIAKVG